MVAWPRRPASLALARSNLHASPALLKRAEKTPDKKLRIHLFDFDAVEAVR